MSGYIFRKMDVVSVVESRAVEFADRFGRFCNPLDDFNIAVMNEMGFSLMFDERDLDEHRKFLIEFLGLENLFDELDDDFDE